MSLARTQELLAKAGSLTREEAVSLYESKWWRGKTAEEIREFCIVETRLCCPWEVMHAAFDEKYPGVMTLGLCAIVENARADRGLPPASEVSS